LFSNNLYAKYIMTERTFDNIERFNKSESDEAHRISFQHEENKKNMRKKLEKMLYIKQNKFGPKATAQGINPDFFDTSISESRIKDFETFITQSIPNLNDKTKILLNSFLTNRSSTSSKKIYKLKKEYFIEALYYSCFHIDNNFNVDTCLNNKDEIFKEAIQKTNTLLLRNAMQNSEIVITRKKFNSTFKRIKTFLKSPTLNDTNIIKQNTKKSPKKKGGKKTRKNRN